jgi:hypothetical protein
MGHRSTRHGLVVTEDAEVRVGRPNDSPGGEKQLSRRAPSRLHAHLKGTGPVAPPSHLDSSGRARKSPGPIARLRRRGVATSRGRSAVRAGAFRALPSLAANGSAVSGRARAGAGEPHALGRRQRCAPSAARGPPLRFRGARGEGTDRLCIGSREGVRNGEIATKELAVGCGCCGLVHRGRVDRVGG